VLDYSALEVCILPALSALATYMHSISRIMIFTLKQYSHLVRIMLDTKLFLKCYTIYLDFIKGAGVVG